MIGCQYTKCKTFHLFWNTQMFIKTTHWIKKRLGKLHNENKKEKIFRKPTTEKWNNILQVKVVFLGIRFASKIQILLLLANLMNVPLWSHFSRKPIIIKFSCRHRVLISLRVGGEEGVKEYSFLHSLIFYDSWQSILFIRRICSWVFVPFSDFYKKQEGGGL